MQLIFRSNTVVFQEKSTKYRWKRTAFVCVVHFLKQALILYAIFSQYITLLTDKNA